MWRLVKKTRVPLHPLYPFAPSHQPLHPPHQPSHPFPQLLHPSHHPSDPCHLFTSICTFSPFVLLTSCYTLLTNLYTFSPFSPAFACFSLTLTPFSHLGWCKGCKGTKGVNGCGVVQRVCFWVPTICECKQVKQIWLQHTVLRCPQYIFLTNVLNFASSFETSISHKQRLETPIRIFWYPHFCEKLLEFLQGVCG